MHSVFTIYAADNSFNLFSLSIFDLLRSPLIHKQGKFPTSTMTATAIIDMFILFGGVASGPARNASIIKENMTMVSELIVHKIHELIDSDTGYVTSSLRKFVLGFEHVQALALSLSLSLFTFAGQL